MNYPKSWKEVTFKQFATLNSEGVSDSYIVSIMTGLSHKEIQEMRDLDKYHEILKSLTFLNKVPDFTELPEKTTFRGKILDIPDDLGNLTVIQIEHMKSLLANKTSETDYSLWTKSVAIWIQGMIEEYDFGKAMELVPEVEMMPCKDVLGIGSFFLKKSTGYINGILNNVQNSYTPSKKKRLGLKNWVSALASYLRFIPYRNLRTSQKTT